MLSAISFYDKTFVIASKSLKNDVERVFLLSKTWTTGVKNTAVKFQTVKAFAWFQMLLIPDEC